MIPLFLIVSKVGLVDTYPGLILPGLNCAFTTLLLVSFFQTIPDDLIDAAKIDGCGYYRIFLKVMLPNARTAIGTASLFAFLTHWRSYMWPLIATNNVKMRTLPIGLKYLVTETSSEYQVMMAASLMAIVPVLVVYMLMEKEFVQSITLTGLKS
jgi:ABC-type glycerol-3-phosphate transport system permease component